MGLQAYRSLVERRARPANCIRITSLAGAARYIRVTSLARSVRYIRVTSLARSARYIRVTSLARARHAFSTGFNQLAPRFQEVVGQHDWPQYGETASTTA